MYCLTNSLFFNILLLYYYTYLNSSIICCLFAGDIYSSFGTYILLLASSICGYLQDFFETLAILSAILLPIK